MISLTRITTLLKPFATGLLTAPPEDLPAHLAGAIREFFEASSPLAAFPGGIHKDKVRAGADYPYLLFTIDSRRSGFDSSTSTWSDTRIRFSALAPGGALAQSLGLMVRESFAGVTFHFRSGMTTPLVLSGDPTDAVGAGRGKDNVRLFRSTVEFECMARRGRS